ncbi:MAG: NHL repeat-containing protein [Coriobacteriia bacterium]|nr:NHL repeat-containing protein [Coriobacteriia bacterium]
MKEPATVKAVKAPPVIATERDLQALAQTQKLVLPLDIARRRLNWALLTFLGILIALGLFLFLYIYNAARPAVFFAQPTPASSQFIRSIYSGGGAALSSPNDVAVADNGDLYVADTGNARIVVFNAQGGFLRQFAQGDPAATAKADQGAKTTPVTAASGLVSPTSIAVGNNGQVYVVDTGLHELVIYTTDGKFVKEITFKEEAPISVSFAPINSNHGRIVVTTKSGVALADADGNFDFAYVNWGSKPGQMDNPASALLTFSHETTDTLYVCDTLNYRIQALTDIETSPTVSWIYGAPLPVQTPLEYQGQSRKFGLPVSLALTSNGELVVVDGLSSELVVLDAHTGRYLRTISTVGNADGQLYYPVGITAAKGRLYVADKYNDRVEVFSDIPGKSVALPPAQTGRLQFDPAWLLIIPGLLILITLARQVFIRTPRYTLDMRFIEQVAGDDDCRDLLVQMRKVRIPLQYEAIAQRRLPTSVQQNVIVCDESALDALQDADSKLSELEAAAIQVASRTGSKDYFLVGDSAVGAHPAVAKVQRINAKAFFALARKK